MSPISFLTQWLAALSAKAGDDECRTPSEDGHEGEAADRASAPDPTVPSLGAWVGWATMKNDATIRRDIAFCKKIGLSRIDVIVNDHAADRKPRDFDTYSASRIRALCRAAADAQIEVHLMSWLMPHARYIDQAASTLTKLALETAASSVMFDAEEPWTRAHNALPYEQAAAMVDEHMGPTPWGVTGIGYAPVDKLGPLVQRAAYVVPQCYATSNNNLDPATVAAKLCGRWNRVFGEHPLVVGLAGYRQAKISGYTPKTAVLSAFAGARSLMPRAVVWWSLRHIRSNRAVAAAITTIAKSLRASA